MFKRYYAPTPKNIRKFADSLLIGALYIQAQPELLGEKWTRYATIMAVAAKMMSNFFKEDVEDKPDSAL